VTHVTGEEAFDSRQEGSGHAQAEEHEALRRGQEGCSHEEAQDDGEEVDDQEVDDEEGSRQEGGSDPEAQEREALDRGQEGRRHQEAQVDTEEVDGDQADLCAEACGEAQDHPPQDDQKEGRGLDVGLGSFSWSGRGAIAPLPRCRIVAGRAASAERRRASLPAAFAHITTS
jgi:hypothetical protein